MHQGHDSILLYLPQGVCRHCDVMIQQRNYGFWDPAKDKWWLRSLSGVWLKASIRIIFKGERCDAVMGSRLHKRRLLLLLNIFDRIFVESESLLF